MDSSTKPILVSDGTGYVGGRLIPCLLAAGCRSRAMGRSPQRLRCRPSSSGSWSRA